MINIILLGLVSFLTDVSSEMIMPILPLFIKQLGGTGIAVGLITGIAGAVASLLKVFSGYFSDIYGKRKQMVFAGYLMSALAKLFFPLSTTWHHILLLRPLERVGKGVRDAPRDAMVSFFAKKKKGKGFGIMRAMDTSGAIIGSLLALLFFWYLGFSFKAIFFIAALFAFLALIPIFFVKEPRVKPQSFALKVGFSQLSMPLRWLIAAAAVFALGNFSYMFFILRAQEAFDTTRSAFVIPILLYVLFNIFYAGFAIPIGILSDRIGRKKILLCGYALFTITCAGFVYFQSLAYLIVLFILYGLTYSLVDATQRAYVSDLAPRNIRGTALGTFHTAVGIAALPAGLIAGYLWDISAAYTFWFGAVMAFIAVILLGFVNSK
jgi:MFS family permease